MKRYKLIYNPSSGKEEAANQAFEMANLIMSRNDAEFTFYATKGKDDAMHKAMEACKDKYDIIFGCGGDGTVHEVVNGIMKSKKKSKLAILPAGTVNDFAGYIEVPDSAEGFYEMVSNPKYKQVDVGKINDDYFMNVIMGGIFANIPHSVSTDEKAIFGKVAYYFRALLEIPEQIENSFDIKYTIDGQVYNIDTHLFLISNTPGAGGFKNLCPDAKFDDGLLDIIIFEKCSNLDLVQIFAGVFNGQHINHPKVRYMQAKSILIESSDEKLVLDVDGEQGGKMPISVSVESKALEILAP